MTGAGPERRLPPDRPNRQKSMRTVKTLGILAAASVAACGAAGVAWAPSIGAAALLYPARRPVTAPRPAGCRDVAFLGAGVTLRGWRCDSRGGRRGTIVFLHGVADNRSSVAGVVDRFVSAGFDVVAYDSRAHGESGGATCTYGYHEKADLRRVVAELAQPVVLVGGSLGGAVALQAAAGEPRIRAVVAAEVFSDLRTVARERTPWFLPDLLIDAAFREAEVRANFAIDEVSPADAAPRVRVPVLLIHGALDTDTPPAHSERVYARLGGPKRLILVAGARHNESLGSAEAWTDVLRWLDEWFDTATAVSGGAATASRSPSDRQTQ
jgi:uncharacterized protein